jgi:hypothetical protein
MLFTDPKHTDGKQEQGQKKIFKSRPCENSPANFHISALLTVGPSSAFFENKEDWVLKLSKVQSCKSPLKKFHLVLTLQSLSKYFATS